MIAHLQPVTRGIMPARTVDKTLISRRDATLATGMTVNA